MHLIKISHDRTTMFLNKYCENIDIPSVAYRVADTIIDYEIMQCSPMQTEDDFDADDEIITEEEFLKDVDDQITTEDEFLKDVDDELDNIESSQGDDECQLEDNDEICDNVETVFDHTEWKTKELAEKAKKTS